MAGILRRFARCADVCRSLSAARCKANRAAGRGPLLSESNLTVQALADVTVDTDLIGTARHRVTRFTLGEVQA